MATTHVISVSFQDYSGDTDSMLFHVPSTATLAEVQSMMNTILPLVDAITGAKIVSSQISLALTLPGGLKASAVSGVDIERGINWRCSAANTQYSHTVRTPAVQDANVNGETLVSDADTNAFVVGLLAGDGVTEPTDPYANDLTNVLATKITFHK